MTVLVFAFILTTQSLLSHTMHCQVVKGMCDELVRNKQLELGDNATILVTGAAIRDDGKVVRLRNLVLTKADEDGHVCWVISAKDAEFTVALKTGKLHLIAWEADFINFDENGLAVGRGWYSDGLWSFQLRSPADKKQK